MTNKEIIKDIPEQLKKAMDYRNYSVDKLSKETKIELTRINEILDEKKIPKLNEIIKFSAYLDVSVNYLCSFSQTIERNSSIIIRDTINLDMNQKSIDILRRIVSFYMYMDDEQRQELLDLLLE